LFFNLVAGRLLYRGKAPDLVLKNNKDINPSERIEQSCQNASAECIDLL
jgi:hypothetical protein